MDVLVVAEAGFPLQSLLRSSFTSSSLNLPYSEQLSSKHSMGLVSKLLDWHETADSETQSLPKAKIPLFFFCCHLGSLQINENWVDLQSLNKILLVVYDVPDTVLNLENNSEEVCSYLAFGLLTHSLTLPCSICKQHFSALLPTVALVIFQHGYYQ